MDLRAFIQSLYDRGDDPFKLAGKRDDTLEMILGMVNEDQSTPDQLMGGAPPPPPVAEQSGTDQMWQQFQDMNPNLDYDKVAEQSGGNVPGGSFTDSRVSPGKQTVQEYMGTSDEKFIEWAKQLEFDTTLKEKIDPRSRGYDPQGAEMMIRKRQGEEDASVREIYNRAEMLKAQTGAKQAEQMSRLISEGMLPSGVKDPNAISPARTMKDYETAASAMQQMAAGPLGEVDNTIITDAARMVMLATAGRFEEADAIRNKHLGDAGVASAQPAENASTGGLPEPMRRSYNDLG